MMETEDDASAVMELASRGMKVDVPEMASPLEAVELNTTSEGLWLLVGASLPDATTRVGAGVEVPKMI